MSEVKSILMVCLGNICRSPVAEGVMKSKLNKYNLSIHVDSAGTAAYHIGENPDHRSIKNARKNGVDISQLIARQFEVADFNRFDRIYVMDAQNLKDVLHLAPTKADQLKVKLLLSELKNSSFKEVPDPYFGGEEGFQLVFDLLDDACDVVAKKNASEQNLIKQ
jgi:protein-tyrosine phosphatase